MKGSRAGSTTPSRSSRTLSSTTAASQPASRSSSRRVADRQASIGSRTTSRSKTADPMSRGRASGSSSSASGAQPPSLNLSNMRSPSSKNQAGQGKELKGGMSAALWENLMQDQRKTDQLVHENLTSRSIDLLSQLIKEGQELMERLGQTGADQMRMTIQSMAGTSPLATVLFSEIIKSGLRERRSETPLTARVCGDLESLLSEGQMLLNSLGPAASTPLLDVVRNSASSSPLAKILYMDLMGSNELGALSERSQHRLNELMIEGSKLLENLQKADADLVHSTIREASGVSPIAAVLYSRILDSVPVGGEGLSPQHPIVPAQVSKEGQKALNEMLVEGEVLRHHLDQDAKVSDHSTDVENQSNGHHLDVSNAAEAQGEGTDTQYEEDFEEEGPDTPQEQEAAQSPIRMGYHDIKDMMALHAWSFIRKAKAAIRDNNRLPKKVLVDVIHEVIPMKIVPKADIEAVADSFTYEGTIDLSEFCRSIGFDSKISDLQTLRQAFSDNFEDRQQALEYMELDGKKMVSVKDLEKAFEAVGIELDIVKIAFQMDIEVCNEVLEVKDFFDALELKPSSPQPQSPDHEVIETIAEESASRRGLIQLNSMESVLSSLDHLFLDDAAVSIEADAGRMISVAEKLPAPGVRLSNQFPGLEQRTIALRRRIAILDKRNQDPEKVGSSAWRVKRQQQRRTALSAPRQKRAQTAPPPDTGSQNLARIESNDSRVTQATQMSRQTSLTFKSQLSWMSSTTEASVDSVLESLAQEFKLTRTPSEDEKPDYGELHHAAAVRIQRRVRGMKDRNTIRPMLRKLITSAVSIIHFRKMKISELNTLYRSVRDSDSITEVLKVQAEYTQAVLDEIFEREQAECEEADKRAEKELVELETAEKEAELEVTEAQAAEERMNKEKEEMLAWQAKAERYRQNYEALRKQRGIIDDTDTENLRTQHPDVFREKNQYLGILQRSEREREQYEAAMAILVKEKEESDMALYKASQERKEWKEAREQALKERQEVEAFVNARKFTDPRVSIKERFRVKIRSSADAPRFVRETQNAKGATQYLGVIFVDDENTFEGEFVVVGDQSEEELEDQFNEVVEELQAEDEALDLPGLQLAMSRVGRRLNLNEADRLVKCFDTDGNGTVEFDEFLAGFKRMVGMVLPHGLGVERSSDGSKYEGEIFEDKRFGIGMYTAPDSQWYLGPWHLGNRHGIGIEGRIRPNGTLVPVAIVQCNQGKRVTKARFSPEDNNHRKMMRSWSLVVDQARKRAIKARHLVEADIALGKLKPGYTVEPSLKPLEEDEEDKEDGEEGEGGDEDQQNSEE